MKTPRSIPWPATAAVVVLVQLLALNCWMWFRNQRLFVKEDRPRIVPRSIATVSALNSYETVRYTFNMYYELRDLDGATLVIPQSMWGHEFYLERVARVNIEIQPNLPVLSNEFLERLRSDGMVTKALHIDVASWLDVVIVKGTKRYLLASSADGKVSIILPEELYRQDAARRS